MNGKFCRYAETANASNFHFHLGLDVHKRPMLKVLKYEVIKTEIWPIKSPHPDSSMEEVPLAQIANK